MPSAAATTKAPVLGKQAKAELPAALFGEGLHRALVFEVARAEAAAKRRGTASTLGRGEVSMTGAKAWRQKGTGRARVGALSSPTRRGGGVAFGPKPRKHTIKVNRKARRRALRAALSVHAERGSVAVLDVAAIKEPSTKAAAAMLAKWDARLPTLVVIDADETAAIMSFRNLSRVDVLPATAIGVRDIVGHKSLVVSEKALEILAARAGDVRREGRPSTDPDGGDAGAEQPSGGGV